ncbi:MAG: thioredoxin domain-containing protein, partial [Bacteroidota bacterium]
ATGNERFKDIAEKNMQFLIDKFSINGSGEFYHTWKNGIAKYPAFLDDYAFLINALIHLYEISTDTKWLQEARKITDFVLNNFRDDESDLFYFTQKNQQDVILHKKEVFDGAVPSGNSMMAYNLYRLAIFFDEKNWKAHALNMLVSLGKVIVTYPSSFGMWTCFLQETIYSTNEVVILGEDFKRQLWQMLAEYIPHKVVMASKESDFYYPLLTGKDSPGSTLIYLCKDFACRQPVNNVQALLEQIKL